MKRVSHRRLRFERPDSLLRAARVEAPFLIERFPAEAPFGFLGRCLPTTLRCEARLHFEPISSRASLDLLHEARSVAETELATGAGSRARSTAELEVQQSESADLARSVAAGEQVLWRLGVSVAGFGHSPARARETREEVERRFRSLGFDVRVPTFEAGRLLDGPIPLGDARRPVGFWHTLPSDAAAAFFPFVDESVREEGGILVGLQLEDASPVVLNRWAESSHSWGVFGATGAGKSFAAALWSLRTRWMDPEVALYFLDPMGEMAGLAEALGGIRVSIGPEGSGRLNPLSLVARAANPAEAAGQFARLLRTLFPELSSDEEVGVETAILRALPGSPDGPTFSRLVASLDDDLAAGRVRALLEVFVGGSLAYLDGATDVDLDRTPLAVDLSGVSAERLAFHLAYLLQTILDAVQHRPGPKLVVVDEAHRLLADPASAEFLDRFVRSARHYRTGVLLLSQNPDDFLATEAGRSMLRNLRATLLLRTNEVSSATGDFFGLTPNEAEWLPRARLPRDAGYAEGLMRWGPRHLPIAVVASAPEAAFLTEALRPGETDRSAAPQPP